jgi:2-methylcitrate dehydratase PrpD
MSINLTEELAKFAANICFDDIPQDVFDRAKIILIDTIASAFAGGSSDEIIQIEKMAVIAAGKGNSPVMGRASLSPAAAALVNGYLITAATVCDVHKATLCHVTPQVLPPAIAVGVDREVSGKEFMLAFVLGIEMTTRIGLGSNYSAFRARGWHSPGVWGPFGGAAAAGKLMNFSAAKFVSAFGLAGSQSAGTFAHWGTPTIKFHQSRGSLSGYLAAQLAAQNFEASKDILTAVDGGLYSTYSNGGSADVARKDLGKQWELNNLSLRPWPLASSLQSVATSLLHLIDNEKFEWTDVESVKVGLSEIVYNMHGTLPWDDRFHALLSAPYVTGVILTDKECWLEQFSPTRIEDKNLDNFVREKISVAIDESVPGTGASISITLRDGRILSDYRKIPHGDYMDPLSLEDVSSKFMKAVGTSLDKVGEPELSGAKRVLTRLKNIENIDRVDGALFGSPS